ncbi:MAG: glutathione S-transferase family protein, partial [Henriciella sp.]
ERAPGLLKGIFGLLLRPLHDKFIDLRIAEHVGYWDQQLAATGWFGGESFSAVDIMMSFPVEAANQRIGLCNYPHVQAFLDRIHQRPAYQAALARGGPYIYA